MKLDQRAWMGVTSVLGKPEVGKELVITIYFKNTGKTPARNVNITWVGEPVRRNGTPDFAIENHEKRESRGIVAPQAEVSATGVGPVLSTPDRKLDEATLKAINGGKFLIYVHGILEYDDIFEKHHWITFCYWLTPGGNNYNLCKEHNDTDNN